MRRGQAQGFTLLEMMIALCILALALTWLIEATTRAVEAENHAKLVTTATFLARQQMVQLEDELQEKGMQDDAFASEKTGDFEDVGFKRFRWKRVVDKITLPGTDALQTAMGAASGLGGQTNQTSQGSTPPPAGPAGIGGMLGASTNVLASQFGIIKEVLEQGIRRATVSILWTERGVTQSVDVSQYLTDPRRVDQAVQLPTMPGALGGANNNQPCPPGQHRNQQGQCVP